MKKRIQRAANGAVKVAATAAVVSCSGTSEDVAHTDDFGDRHVGTAQASPADAGTDVSADTTSEQAGAEHDAIPDEEVEAQVSLPDNPSYISLITEGEADDVAVYKGNGAVSPWPKKVVRGNGRMITHLILPKSENLGIMIAPVSAVGTLIGSPIQARLRIVGKIGTAEIAGGAQNVHDFPGGSQTPLKLGENVVSGPVTRNAVNGEEYDIVQGVFMAPEDGEYTIEWSGTEKVFAFLDTSPAEHTQSLKKTLKAGQELALWAVVTSDDPVVFNIGNSTCASP